MFFGPRNAKEAEVFALEELRADVQYELAKAIQSAGQSQKSLAEKLGCSPAWISQLLSDDANLTLESISKVFLALNRSCKVSAVPLGAHFGVGEGEMLSGEKEQWSEVTSETVSKREWTATSDLLAAVFRDVHTETRHDYDSLNDNFSHPVEWDKALA